MKIIRYKRVRSTQDTARRLAEKGAQAGTVVVAETQSCGRGRRGAKWSSGKGGLWFSIILRPARTPADTTRISVNSARVVRDALRRQTGVTLTVKPPNDLLYQGKKICGILAESVVENERVKYLILGIGLNVNNRLPANLSNHATTLSKILGHSCDRIALFNRLLSAMEVYRR
jgi:BirA family biotin operon repressor/biotin-[acetyl-CoA-carboxylase] ligase